MKLSFSYIKGMIALIYIFSLTVHLACRHCRVLVLTRDSFSCFIVAHGDYIFQGTADDLFYLLNGFVYSSASDSIFSDMSHLLIQKAVLCFENFRLQ